jgi:hypothetical protein
MRPILLLALLCLAPRAVAADLDPIALLTAQRASALGTEARRVEGLDLDVGLARVRLEEGWVFPVVTPDGQATPEVVFRGRGRLTLSPIEPVEAAQLEVFTDAAELDEAFTEAVFVIANPSDRQALLGGPAASVSPGELAAAKALQGRWRASRERVIMGIPGALWRIGLGESLFAEFFGGFFLTENHGRVLYMLDPEDDEQVSLGRFVPLEVDRKKERTLRRLIHREQRHGRFEGLDLEDLGSWDTWVSASLPERGRATFEPRHYGIRAQVAQGGTITGTVEIELTATAGGARTVELKVHPETKISALRDAAGRPVPYAHEEQTVVALLPEAPAAGETTTLAIDFSGPFLERSESHRIGDDIWHLTDTVNWYPHAGNIDRATYEVDLTSALGVVVAPGAPAGSKPAKDGHFLLDRPCFGFTFETGDFKSFTDTKGEIPITVHLDPRWRDFDIDGEALADQARQALDYLQEIFGPLPHDRLILVTAPRGYSQSFPGHLVLADGMMSARWSAEDPRTVIAHELAHQWWGHLAGFSTYRDQWLSEALANYASVLYGREKLDRNYGWFRSGPTGSWQETLNQITANGMPLENLGPVVLGGRLDSSIADAYTPIVYGKGALILDMLHNLYGPSSFLAALRKILVDPESRELTTAEFLAGLERHAGGDLKEFGERFIYGVGLPEVYYSYRFEAITPGKWAVVGTARQQAPYHYRYKLRAMPRGLPDVVRETIEKARISQSSIVAVPVEIGLFQTNAPPPSRKLSKAEQKVLQERVLREGNAVLRGRTVLRGPEASFRFETTDEPRRLWFDRHEEVFTMFYDEQRFPRRMAAYRGIDHAAAGRIDEAEATFREALTLPVTTDPEPIKETDYQRLAARFEADRLDRWVHQRLARLLLDADRLGEAETELALSKGGDRAEMPLWQKHEERTLEARLALRQGRPERTLELLSGGFAKLQVGTREAQALLAVAAWATGDARVLAEARKAAEKAGIDLALLDPAPPRP